MSTRWGGGRAPPDTLESWTAAGLHECPLWVTAAARKGTREHRGDRPRHANEESRHSTTRYKNDRGRQNNNTIKSGNAKFVNTNVALVHSQSHRQCRDLGARSVPGRIGPLRQRIEYFDRPVPPDCGNRCPIVRGIKPASQRQSVHAGSKLLSSVRSGVNKIDNSRRNRRPRDRPVGAKQPLGRCITRMLVFESRLIVKPTGRAPCRAQSLHLELRCRAGMCHYAASRQRGVAHDA